MKPIEQDELIERLHTAIFNMRKAAYEFGITHDIVDHERMLQAHRLAFDEVNRLAQASIATPQQTVAWCKGYVLDGTQDSTPQPQSVTVTDSSGRTDYEYVAGPDRKGGVAVFVKGHDYLKVIYDALIEPLSAEKYELALNRMVNFDDMRDEYAQQFVSLKEQNALLTVQVPEGWKLVPMESTQDMERAGFHKAQDQKALIRDIYKAMLAAAPDLPQQVGSEDKMLLDAIQNESWDVRCINLPTPGGDDADIGWQVIEHHMAKPHERVIGENFNDDVRAALRAAISAQEPNG